MPNPSRTLGGHLQSHRSQATVSALVEKRKQSVYTLYFAPDNASLIVRIALEEIGADYTARSVDRSAREQESEAYRKLNPNGLIPVCIMDGEPVFETAAIVLSLADRHGELAPKPDDPARPGFLKWLFFLSNTVHTDLRMLFYPTQYVGADDAHQQALKSQAWDLLRRHLTQLEHHYAESNGAFLLGPDPSIADIYLGLCLRWPQLYPPSNRSHFNLKEFPALSRMAAELQERPAVVRSFEAEGIPAPFLTDANFPDGSRGAPT